MLGLLDYETPPLGEVVELHVDEAEDVLNLFHSFVQHKPDLDTNQQQAVLALPLFQKMLLQLKEWGGNVNDLPDSEEMITSVNGYVETLKHVMDSSENGAHYE